MNKHIKLLKECVKGIELHRCQGASVAIYQWNKNGCKILLGKRTIEPSMDKWDLFGGGKVV